MLKDQCILQNVLNVERTVRFHSSQIQQEDQLTVKTVTEKRGDVVKYKRYPKYKDSGVEWIGDIPEEWEVKRLKHVLENKPFAIVDGPFGTQLHSSEYVDDGIPLMNVNNIDKNGNFVFDNIKYISLEKLFKLNIITSIISISSFSNSTVEYSLFSLIIFLFFFSFLNYKYVTKKVLKSAG